VKDKIEGGNMRIIAGDAKGKRLKMVPGKHVRPTTDRVKESLFAVIGPFFAGGTGLDLFAGTGSLGLEAISRGMDEVIFVDQSGVSLRVAKENAAQCGFLSQAKFFRRDARSACKYFANQNMKFELIFLDPPYYEQLLVPVLQLIADHHLLSPTGTLVVEHPRDISLAADNEWQVVRELAYGDTMITLLREKEK
jgi:16S rRNA (guanine966-N2)-methyltransferase